MAFLILFCSIIGFGAGILGGLMGVSGGLITVPSLVYLFRFYGFPTVDLLQLAIGTSLAAMVFNTLASMRAHHAMKAINWKIVKALLPGLVLGCFAGSYLGHLLPSTVLELFFGIFAIVIGVNFYRKDGLEHFSEGKAPKTSMLNGLGFGIGALSNILGIGGGSMTVPLFVRLKMPLKTSVATSTATGFIITLIGAVSYLVFGLGQSFYPKTVGFIYIPAFVTLAVTTSLTAPLGAKWAHKIKTDHLKKAFAISLLVIGVLMVLEL